MTENTTTPANSENNKAEDVKELTDAQKKEMFASLPKDFQDTVTNLNKEIDAHNQGVASLQSADKKDANLIKAEVFEQTKDKDVKRLYDEYVKMLDAAEKLKTQAYGLIESKKLMPAELTPEAIEKLKTEVTESTKSLRAKISAIEEFEKMMPMIKGKVLPLLTEIKTRRGISSSAKSSAQEGTRRLRFDRIEINDVIEDEKGNKVYSVVKGEPKFTFTFASQYLKKQHKGIDWSPKDLTDAYLASVPDADNLPLDHTFEMPFTYKNGAGTEETVIYRIKTKRA